LGIASIPTESATGWGEVLSGLRKRGVKEVGLVVSDGLCAIEDAVASVWGQTAHQLCAIHLQRNVLSAVKPKDKGAVAEGLKEVFVTGDPTVSIAKGWSRWQAFCGEWSKKYPSIGKMSISERYQMYFTYLDYDYRIRGMIYSTNWVERLNRDYKRTTRMRGALPDAEATILLLGYVAMSRKAYDRKLPKMNYEKVKFRWEEEEENQAAAPCSALSP
jgi:transposase-like protein